MEIIKKPKQDPQPTSQQKEAQISTKKVLFRHHFHLISTTNPPPTPLRAHPQPSRGLWGWGAGARAQLEGRQGGTTRANINFDHSQEAIRQFYEAQRWPNSCPKVDYFIISHQSSMISANVRPTIRRYFFIIF